MIFQVLRPEIKVTVTKTVCNISLLQYVSQIRDFYVKDISSAHDFDRPRSEVNAHDFNRLKSEVNITVTPT